MAELFAVAQCSGIPTDVLEAMVSSANRYARRITLFGSRARGDHRQNSDMDIAFFGSKQGYLSFMEAMEQLPTLMEFDCVHITPETSPELTKNIRKDGIVLMDTPRQKTVQLSRAVARLQEAVTEYDQTSSKAVRDGAIQRFEFCAELSWKAVQEYLQTLGYTDVLGPKPVMRKAFSHRLITDEQGWLALLNARNQTSHLYDDQIADAVYQAVVNSYIPLLLGLVNALETAEE